ncbi:hypothetical protein [Sphingomonas phyllosphaerae]|uniref:hypothetical protein n=1 Tax=Sphingomonas phyllosphaerae TaxID=257003 RepID=UPI0024138239|nr:hypothetical protein [Sphingomonas phyllosphaerae]
MMEAASQADMAPTHRVLRHLTQRARSFVGKNISEIEQILVSESRYRRLYRSHATQHAFDRRLAALDP